MREKKIKLLLLENLENSNQNYKNIANVLLQFDGSFDLKLKRIASDAFTSITTVERFVKQLGFANFTELKVLLIEEVSSTKVEVENNIPKDREDYWNKYHFIINKLSNETNYEKIEEFSNILLEINQIKCIALGSSALITADFEQKFDRLGLNVKSYNDLNLARINIRNLKNNDVLFAVSYSGYTEEVINLLFKAQKNGVKTVLITSNENLLHVFDYVFIVPKVENYQRSGTMFSRILMMNIIDLIYLSFAENNLEFVTQKIDHTNYYL